MITQEQLAEIAMTFLAFRDQLKLYHWQTTSYPRHIAADALVLTITNLMDTFMETIQGSNNIRLKILNKNNSIKFTNQNEDSIVEILKYFKKWLTTHLSKYIKPSDTDLSNIRDDMLVNVNKTMYLFSLK